MPFSLIPDLVFPSVLDISPETLRALPVEGVILDLDNTLARYSEASIAPDITDWLEGLRRAGFSLFVLSNNRRAERLAALLGSLGIRYRLHAKKPAAEGFFACARDMGLPPERIAVIGDQIFTDVLGGNRARMRTVLVTPRGLYDNPWFAIRHAIELPFIHISKRRSRK
ncbi:YqeG family HAD IIIA-type phosphatase [Oscillospiraceae bacterium OttesenSCG-928-G22]|nr:YqeG family HAD IIIA-type phosphatase [Oscillospiraceae bacterium OttesenSCG-928-G22]